MTETEHKTFLDDAKAAVKIDETALDKECLRLPTDYLKFAYNAAMVKMDVDVAKAEMERIEADLSTDIRERPGKYGLEKVTESAIKAVILTQKAFTEAQDEYFKAKRDAEFSQSVVWALEQKKRSLTLLVDLHGTSYFANPKLSEEGTRVVERMTQQNVRRPRRNED